MSDRPAPVAVPAPAAPSSREDRLVRITQWGLAATAPVAIGSIIFWITHLIRTALRWGDVPSGAIGISLVAIPVFLMLLGVMLYVFIGLLTDRSSS